LLELAIINFFYQRYILGVESQFICDILPFADDESGLIEAAPDLISPSDQIESMFDGDFET
jgi:hypothetical protein